MIPIVFWYLKINRDIGGTEYQVILMVSIQSDYLGYKYFHVLLLEAATPLSLV